MTTKLESDLRLPTGIGMHAEVHAAVALDQLGRRLATRNNADDFSRPTALVSWAREFGTIECIGMEGTGSYGAGLAGWLRAEGGGTFSRWSAQSGRPAAAEGSRTRSTPKWPLELIKPELLSVNRKLGPGTSR